MGHPGRYRTRLRSTATNGIGHEQGQCFKVPVSSSKSGLASHVGADGKLQELRDSVEITASSDIDHAVSGRAEQAKLLKHGLRADAFSKKLSRGVNTPKQIANRPDDQLLRQPGDLQQLAHFCDGLPRHPADDRGLKLPCLLLAAVSDHFHHLAAADHLPLPDERGKFGQLTIQPGEALPELLNEQGRGGSLDLSTVAAGTLGHAPSDGLTVGKRIALYLDPDLRHQLVECAWTPGFGPHEQ